MPVKRDRVEIRSTASASPVNAPQLRLGDNFRMLTEMAARRANEFGKAMAAEAEDKGVALAKAATFSVGPNGMPQLPENATARMGSIAQRSYDGVIEDRYAHQLTTALRAQLEDAHISNQYDFDGFLIDAQSRIDAMASEVPEQFAGAFQQISTGVMADMGASIGHRQARLDMQTRAAELPGMVDSSFNTVQTAVAGGNDAVAAQLVEDTFAMIDAEQDHIVSPVQKEAMKRDFAQRVGWARLSRDLDIESMGPAELSDLALAMQNPNDERAQELAREYFTLPGQTDPDWELMGRAAGQVNQYLSRANQRVTAEDAQAREQSARNVVAAGAGTGSAEDRRVLDRVLGEQLNLYDDSGARRATAPGDWLTMDDETRHAAVDQIKRSGFLPASMAQMFTMMKNTDDPETMGLAFELYLDLRHMEGRDLTSELPEETLAVYQMAEMLHDTGRASDYPLRDAFARVAALEGQTWGDYELFRAVGDGVRSGRRDTVDEKNVRERFNAHVNQVLFTDQNIDPTPAERDRAAFLVEHHLRMGEPLETALIAGAQMVDGMYVESKFMAGNVRSSYAPERHYPTPGPGSIGEMIDNSGRGLSAAGRSVGEAAAELPFLAFELLTGVELFDSDLGGDWREASPFELMADAEILRMLEDHPDGDLVGEFGKAPWYNRVIGVDRDGKRTFFKPGEDYQLLPNKGTGGGPPTYTVVMMGPGGIRRPVGTLDLRDQWGAFTTMGDKAGAFQRSLSAEDRERMNTDPDFRREKQWEFMQTVNPDHWMFDQYPEWRER